MNASERRFLIICGGTGGHLSPGIALAERLRRRGHVCRLVVSRKEIDGRLSRKYAHLDFAPVPGVGMRFTPFGMVRFGFHFLLSLLIVGRLVRRFDPTVLVVFGGFLSPPFVLWARLRGIPVAVHEANRRPGRATRMLARFAQRAYVPVGVRLGGIRPSRVHVSGYPVREEIAHVRKDLARAQLGFNNHGKVLVVIGGSQGAEALNTWAAARELELARQGVNLVVVTGPGKGEDTRRSVETSTAEESSMVHYMAFCDDMGLLFSVADLVISRAGAGAIAELSRCLAPSILVPYPYAADQHQKANAAFFERQGGCLVLPQTQIDERLLGEVRELLFNDWMLHRMRENLRALDRGDAAADLAMDLERFLNRAIPPRAVREAGVTA